MAKPKNVIPTIEKKVQIPMDLVARMELELHSDLEGRIPYGAQSEFINRLIREHYQRVDQASEDARNGVITSRVSINDKLKPFSEDMLDHEQQ